MNSRSRHTLFTAALVLAVGISYYFSNPKPQNYYDYTYRVAGQFLKGRISLDEPPRRYLNEFVPVAGSWYSVFPFGAVVSMVPFALLRTAGLVGDMPGSAISAIVAAASCLLMLLIARHYDVSNSRKVLTTLAILFGTFTWTNITIAGAWQLALGFAMVGELGAIYFTVFDRRPFIAGIFFAFAFGNRTEILLTAPVFLYLLNRGDAEAQRNTDEDEKEAKDIENIDSSHLISSLRLRFSAVNIRSIAAFCVVPFILGVATLIYNYTRFQSIADFGYARIPGVLNEPWYGHGIFSAYYIPRQAWEMLFRPWERMHSFPYLVPNAFSSSILWSSPFLLFVVRRGACDKALKKCAWVAIVVLTLLLWMHGNSGGWQFGYRYAIVLLPWVFVVLLENAPKRISPLEWAAYILSIAVNTYALWLFHWTNYLRP